MAQTPKIGDRNRVPHGGRAVAAASAALALALALGGCGAGGAPAGSGANPGPSRPVPSHSDRPAARPTTTTATAEPPRHFAAVPVAPKTRRAARRATAAYLVASGRALARPARRLAARPAIGGAALQTLLAMRTEYASKHYRVVGEPVLVHETVIRRRVRPPELVVAACLDNSHVHVFDKTGAAVPTPGAAARSLNLFTLERRAGRWVVVGSAFPDDPDC